jgi:hypothetical protein
MARLRLEVYKEQQLQRAAMAANWSTPQLEPAKEPPVTEIASRTSFPMFSDRILPSFHKVKRGPGSNTKRSVVLPGIESFGCVYAPAARLLCLN